MIYFAVVQITVLSTLLANVQAVSQAFCSSENTGVSADLHSYAYQSNGWCSDTCNALGTYNYAIVQNTECWCSNNAPDSTVSLTQCHNDCPGYPIEKCGGDSTYGYIQLRDVVSSDVSRSGTSSSSSNSNSQSSSSTSTSTSSSSGTTVAETTESSSKQQTTATTSSSIEPVTSVIYSVKTITGSQETQYMTTEVISTIINLPSQTSTPSNGDTNRNSFFDSPGKVAGTFTVVGLVVISVICVLLYCCFFKRRNSDDDDDESLNHSETSLNQASEKFGIVEPALSNDNSTTQKGSLTKSAAGENGEMFDFVEVDQRLDPTQVFNYQNGSRASLADDMDYSRRVLRVTNA